MSLILEALRKSEAERRRGQAPDVLAEMPVVQPAARRTAPAWLWLLPLLLVLVAALWFVRNREKTLPGTTLPVPTQQPGREQPAEPALPAVQRLVPQPQAAQARAARPIAEAPSPPPVADAPPTAPGKHAVRHTTPTTAMPPGAIPQPAIPQDAQARPLEPLATRQPATAPPADTNTPRVASLSDLTTNQRESLPPLKISMHLWNADPARRFVILDGNRVVEGDRVGDAVVKDITTDGVVIDWHGQRIKLPIR